MRFFTDLKSKQINGLSANYYVAPPKAFVSETLGEHDTFGMDELETIDNLVDREAICLTDCEFYKMEKRLLAIIITSFEL
jgi:hypothetical protein